MSKKVNAVAQLNGFMTITDTDRLPMEIKQKIVSAPAGKERRFQKLLVDPNVLSPEVKELVLAELAALEEAKASETDAKAKAAINTGKVLLNGRAYIGGFDKDGNAVKDRKNSLTCRISFKVQNVESVLADAKAADKKEKPADEDLLASLMG